MTTVIAGYFDSEDEATKAMDTLLQDPRYRDAESEVISAIARGTGYVGGMVATPFMPNTSGGPGASGGPGGTAFPGAVPVTGGHRLFDELDEEEAEYFRSALNNGRGVLALIRVEDENAMHVGQIFNQHGARTYQDR